MYFLEVMRFVDFRIRTILEECIQLLSLTAIHFIIQKISYSPKNELCFNYLFCNEHV